MGHVSEDPSNATSTARSSIQARTERAAALRAEKRNQEVQTLLLQDMQNGDPNGRIDGGAVLQVPAGNQRPQPMVHETQKRYS